MAAMEIFRRGQLAGFGENRGRKLRDRRLTKIEQFVLLAGLILYNSINLK
jgi:hypothetical protein